MSGESGRGAGDVEGVLRGGIASMSLGAGVLHASVVPDHQGLPFHLAFFLVTAVVQGGLAAVVLRSRSGRWLALAAACNGLIALIWVLSRTSGVPVQGATVAEPIGFKDAITTLLEIGVVAGAGLVAILGEAGRRVPLAVNSLASTVMAASVWGLAMAGLVAHHTHDDHVHAHHPSAGAAVDSHHHAAAIAALDEPHGDDPGSETFHGHHHLAVPGGGPDHHEHGPVASTADGVHRVRVHHHDAESQAFTDDGLSPIRGRAEHTHGREALAGTGADGHEHPQHESDSMDRADDSRHGPDPGGPAESAGGLIDDVQRLLEK